MYKNFALAGIAFVISSFCFIYFSFYIAYAAPDQELTYHGKLTDTLGLAVPNGTYSFTLTIYDGATGTGCLWTARGTCSSPIPKSLTVTDGVFTTTLGESGDNTLNIDFSTNYYLGVTIDSNAEMVPRKKITPTGFALNANRLDGLTADNYINTSSTAQTKNGDLGINGNLAINTNDLFVNSSNGRVGIGTTSPEEMLTVDGGLKIGNTTNTNAGTIRWTGTDFEGYDGSGWVSLTPDGNTTTFLGLTDTPNSYTNGSILFTSSTNVTEDNANFFWDDVNNRLGLGKNTPEYQLDVNGSARVGDLITQNMIISGRSTSVLNSYSGHNGYTNFSGGIGTGGLDSIFNAQRITSTGNLTNIGSIQAGEVSLTKGGTFATKVDYATGAFPYDVAVGDVNGDGKPDLVAASGNVGISVLMNNGNGTFASKVDYAAPGAYSVTVDDFNGDGMADVAVANYGTTNISVFLNNGNGTFASRVTYGVGTFARSVSSQDLNGDGKADLAVGNSNSSVVSVLMNNGNGTFATKVDYATGSGSESVSIGDLNGDGKADLAVANITSNTVSVLMNNGNGTFATKVDYATGQVPEFVSIGDLNGDGREDLAVANWNNSTISVLMNNGNGTFATKVDYVTGSSPRFVDIGDLNGDGKADLVANNWFSDSVSVLLNNGDGTFAARVEYSSDSDPYGVSIGDLNGDGKMDLAVANSSSSSVSVLLNQPQAMFYAQASTGNVGIGDTTPDHKLDVAGNIGLNAGGYVNFGDTDGTTGYGFRDNGGTLEFKNSAGSWTAIGFGGSTTFLGLTDTPAAYTANQYVRVNATGTGLEFVDLPADADTLGSLLCSSGQVAQWDGSDWVCVTMSGGGMAIGGAITSATAGSILFAGTAGVLQQDNANFFWDDTNNRLGLGTSSPSAMLSIFGTNNKLRLSYDETNYADISVDNAGQLTMNASSAAESAMVIGTGIAQDTSIQFDGISYDYFSGIDDATGLYVIGAGMNVTASATLTGPGTVTNTAGGTTVTGTNTKFLSTFRVGNTITIGAQTVAISAIASDTSMTTAAITSANTNATYTYNGGTKLSVEPSGNVGIGKADPEYALDVLGTGTTGVIARFNSTNATGCTLATNGTISCSSDERLKKNIADLNYGIGTIMSLRPTVYNWNYEKEGSVKSLGFIAQEVENVLPQLVNTDIESGYKQLNTIGLIPVLTRAMQDQQYLIETNANNLTTKATATSLLDLQEMTDAQFTEVSGILKKMQGDTLTMQGEANKKIADMELDISYTQANVSVLNQLFNIDPTDGSEEAHAYILDLAVDMQKILAIDPDQLVMKNDAGDVSIAGIMTADVIVAEKVETKKLTIVDDDKETVGIAVICPENKIFVDNVCKESADENDERSDGKSVQVMSDMINENTTIFTSFESNPGASSWIEKEQDVNGNFIGFTIRLDDVVEEAVRINWWVVEMK